MVDVSAEQTWVVQVMDPTELELGDNIWEVKPDPELVASIRDVGVLEPVTAVRTAEGRIKVRRGAHRTLCAIEADKPVPVIVVGDEDTTTEAEIERIVSQHAENKYRRVMLPSENANVAVQLSGLGLSDTKIGKRLQMTRPQVKAAKAVVSSEAASSALDLYDLDIMQAALVAEFADDQGRVDELVWAARSGRSLEHIAARYRQADEDQAARRAYVEGVEAEGLRVIQTVPGSTDSVRYVEYLTDEDGSPVDPEAHRTCPGHAVRIEQSMVWVAPDGQVFDDDDDVPDEIRDEVHDEYRWTAIPVCDKATRHGSGKPSQNTQQAADARQQKREDRAAVITGNKEWDAAVDVRREWLRNFLKRKTMPAGAVAFLASEMLTAHYAVTDAFRDHHPLAADLLGITPADSEYVAGHWRDGTTMGLRKAADEASDKRRLVILLAIVLGGNEKALNRQSWRKDPYNKTSGCEQREYLQFIIDQGYQPCRVELLAAGLPTGEEGESEPEAGDDADHQAEGDDADEGEGEADTAV
ncbi:hypothetical protein E0H75_42405 [Kribbella capetownensis]|uniref:ParB-like N-terminal domain-containing protein n=1 Tax=Kribbella capetownensis TaxID=1572659 RepID=A0A4R0IM27_9ACTN|nr:ParB N-terminal domain-containing protein [Kribbella capetownensis]TCC33909.1 hypothetical protein E0H75_42405 [Kribbella capetownensis]